MFAWNSVAAILGNFSKDAPPLTWQRSNSNTARNYATTPAPQPKNNCHRPPLIIKTKVPTCCCCSWLPLALLAAGDVAATVLIIFNGWPAAIADVMMPLSAFPDGCTSLNIWWCPAETTKKQNTTKPPTKKKKKTLTPHIAYHEIRAGVLLAHPGRNQHRVPLPLLLLLKHPIAVGLAKRSPPLQNGDSGQRTFHNRFSRTHSTPKTHRNVVCYSTSMRLLKAGGISREFTTVRMRQRSEDVPFRARTSGDRLAAGTKRCRWLVDGGHVPSVRAMRRSVDGFWMGWLFRALFHWQLSNGFDCWRLDGAISEQHCQLKYLLRANFKCE